MKNIFLLLFFIFIGKVIADDSPVYNFNFYNNSTKTSSTNGANSPTNQTQTAVTQPKEESASTTMLTFGFLNQGVDMYLLKGNALGLQYTVNKRFFFHPEITRLTFQESTNVGARLNFGIKLLTSDFLNILVGATGFYNSFKSVDFKGVEAFGAVEVNFKELSFFGRYAGIGEGTIKDGSDINYNPRAHHTSSLTVGIGYTF